MCIFAEKGQFHRNYKSWLVPNCNCLVVLSAVPQWVSVKSPDAAQDIQCQGADAKARNSADVESRKACGSSFGSQYCLLLLFITCFLLHYIHVVCDQDVDVGGILLLRAYHVCELQCSQCLYGRYVRCTRSCLVAIFYISIDSQQYFYMLNALPNAPWTVL